MNSGEGGAPNAQIRAPRSRSWLQSHVNFFAPTCSWHRSEQGVAVMIDPVRRNGCNRQLSIGMP